MKRIIRFLSVLLILITAFGLNMSAQKKIVDSKTSYAADVLQPYVDNGQLPGAISVFYKDGVQRATGPQPWKEEIDKAAEKFFSQSFGKSGVDAYTGRLE